MNRPVFLTALAAVALAAACSPGGRQQSTPPPAGPAIKVDCAQGDRSVVEAALGWAFCYPGTWRYNERLQGTDAPKGVDATFDITDFVQGPDSGKFGFMIVSTDERGQAASLAGWVAANEGAGVKLKPISWGNAVEAAQEVGGDDPSTARFFALTQHQVIVMELRSGQGNLDLDTAMSSRLQTWKFVY